MTEVISDPLVGKYFVIFDDGPVWNHQGIVHARVTQGVYLVQYYDALGADVEGSLSMRLVSIEEMMRPSKGWVFFEDRAGFQEWYGDYRRPLNPGVDRHPAHAAGRFPDDGEGRYLRLKARLGRAVSPTGRSSGDR
jgi:hypothetical protein